MGLPLPRAIFAFAAVLVSTSAALAQSTWQVTNEQKSQKLTPINTGKVSITVTGPACVVVRIGSTNVTLCPSDGTVTFDVPAGSDVYVIQDGTPTSGTWKDGTP